MKRMMWAAACTVAACWASQPIEPALTITSNLALTNNSALQIHNSSRLPVTLLVAAGPLGSLRFEQQRVTISGGRSAEVNLGLLPLRGLVTLHVQSSIIAEGGAAENGPSLYEIFQCDGSVRKLDYKQAFVARRELINLDARFSPGVVDLGAGYRATRKMARFTFSSQDLPVDARITPIDEPDIDELLTVWRQPLPAPGGVSYGGLLPIERAQTAVAEAGAGGRGIPSETAETAGLSIKGGLFIKSSPTVTIPGWGWTAEVWQLIDNDWELHGSARVKHDGTWSANLDEDAQKSVPTHIHYVAGNRFFQIQDADGDVYSWKHSMSKLQDTGNQVIDLTVTGDLPGLADMFHGGMQEWARFKAVNINPLMDDPIEITFPNTLDSGKCQSTDSVGNTIAWSCSYWSQGQIYIIPKHANATVVQHEMAHSINAYYWSSMPGDAGGKHKLGGCFTPGLALTEGFADFVAYWVQLKRNNTAPSIPNLTPNLESLSSSICTGQTNEMRVAATMWDMYDTINDGTNVNTKFDGWNFVNEGAPVSLYLGTTKTQMTDYLAQLLLLFGPSGWQGANSLFRLNTIIN
ncbi:MAG: hypothetical protein JSU00_06960 [Acidobacteria bacterium]|nr:hypothetical protein [Acidobacteriota bacterium]